MTLAGLINKAVEMGVGQDVPIRLSPGEGYGAQLVTSLTMEDGELILGFEE